MKKYFVYIILAITVVVGVALRIWRIGEAPPSVNWDEASLGYNAYSILKTGKDEYSRVLPLSLRSFDDYKPGLYAYLAIPSIALLNLSDISTRLPSALMGGTLILSIFIITRLIFKSKTVALLSAILVAFSPWALHFSRGAWEANVANSLLYIGVALFFWSFRKSKYYILSVVFFVLSMYAYHSPRAIALPLLLVLSIIFKNEIPINNIKQLGKTLAVIAILLFPLAINFFTDPITSRLGSTNILKLWPFVPIEFPQLVLYPLYTFAWHVTSHFLSYLSPVNLFLKGSQEPGQYIPTLGLFNLIELPFWIVGIFILKKYESFKKFIIPILLIGTLPALITWNWFSVVRTLVIYPAYSIVTALGVWELLKSKSKVAISGLIIGALIWIPSVSYLINTELIFAPTVTYGEYQPGFERTVPFVLSLVDSYDKVIIDSPHIAGYIFLLFYGPYDPKTYQSQLPNRIKNSGTESVPFGKFEFRKIDWPKDKELERTLFVGPTVRMSDSDFENTDKAEILGDIYDLLGYISLRVAATK